MARTFSHGKYLGLPSVSGRKKRDMFLNIIDRIQAKIENWNGRILSKGGKEVLIKSVLQAIPSYSMSCFKFPTGVIEEITGLIRKFWWGAKDGENKICWVAWRKITQKKTEGGLGFKNLESFNLAFLAKQGWRLLLSPHSLLGKVLKARYFPNVHFLHASLGSTPSFTWRGIMAAKEFLLRGLGRSINSGFGTKILGDNWIPGHPSSDLIEEGLNFPLDARVSELIDHDLGTWRTDFIFENFPQAIGQAILAIPLGNVQNSDRWIWRPASTGKFSVKSAYKFIFSEMQQLEEPLPPAATHQLWRRLWKLSVPPRMIHFLWRSIYDALPFANTLARRGVLVDDVCPFCEEDPNSAHHLFFGCNFAMRVWKLCNLDEAILLHGGAESAAVFSSILVSNNINIDLFCITCYLIWHYRNRALFEGVRVDDIMIRRAAATILTDYCNFNGWPERFPNSLGCKLWNKPPSKGLRVFFDGALSRLTAGGTGVFVTNENGDFLHGASKFYFGIDDAEVIEMLALRDALRLALQLGLHSFSLLGDSQTTILSALGEVDHPSICTAVLDDIKNLLLHVAFIDLFWVRRSENLVAHELAFFAKNNFDCNESWSSVPDFLLSIRTG